MSSHKRTGTGSSVSLDGCTWMTLDKLSRLDLMEAKTVKVKVSPYDGKNKRIDRFIKAYIDKIEIVK